MAKAVGSTKFCPKCKTFLELDRFSSDGRRADGLKVWCRSCRTNDARERYRRNPQKYAAKLREARLRNLDLHNRLARLSARRHAGVRSQRFQAWLANGGIAWVAAWRVTNKEKLRQQEAAWRQNNKDSVRLNTQRYRARKSCSRGMFSVDDVRNIMRLQRGRCAYCRRRVGKSYHVDHIIPLILGGQSWPSNIQITCRSCNCRKAGKDPLDYAQQLGRLL